MSRYAEVYSANYRIDAQFSGLRYLMFHYPMTAAFFGTSLNMFILTAILILSWYRFFANPITPIDEDEVDYRDPFEVESAKNSENGDPIKENIEDDLKKENILGENVEKLKKESDTDEDLDTLPDFASSKEIFG